MQDLNARLRDAIKNDVFPDRKNSDSQFAVHPVAGRRKGLRRVDGSDSGAVEKAVCGFYGIFGYRQPDIE
jgi:hypothetical protein